MLVKKARGLWVRDSLGPWLHQVAYRTASCARSAAARRRRHEQRAAAVSATRESHAEPDDELGRVLHEEIERLPERYRAPAGPLRPRGAARTSRQRGIWDGRSGRSRAGIRGGGSGSATGSSAAAWPRTPGCSPLRRGPGGADVLVPAALVDSTTRAAIQLATVRTFVAGSAASLAQGVLRSMITIQWLKAASVVLVLGATASAVDLLA